MYYLKDVILKLFLDRDNFEKILIMIIIYTKFYWK